MTDIQTQLSERYIEGIASQVAPGTSRETEFGMVRHNKGRVTSVAVSLPNGDIIDFSQDPDGNAAPGWIEHTRVPGHDDERIHDFSERVVFPETEGDIAFMEGVLRALREEKPDKVA